MAMGTMRSMMGGLTALALLGAGASAAWAESAAEIAVREAKQYAGTEINVIWEAGLQSLGPQNFLRPEVGGAHGHQGQRDRVPGERDVPEDAARASRGDRRL